MTTQEKIMNDIAQPRDIDWKQQIQTWKLSGLSQARFCKNNNLTYHRFVYWRGKFDDATRVSSTKQARQALSLPILNDLKSWLEKNVSRVPKDGLIHKAISYTLNQWNYLIGYCEDGKLHISNALAENAIRPFAVGRRAWLFADTSRGARASATCYSLVESAKANDLEPYAYLRHVLAHIGEADTVEKFEALLPWNMKTDG